MNIGTLTFEEFKAMATRFHGYAAPGLLIGGYMVEKAKAAMPEKVLYEVLVESGKCLPDAVQLLTPCSIGNNWMKIYNLGRYAVSLYDKYTGEGVRVHLDPKLMQAWPEIEAWFFKRKPKAEQDEVRLAYEIEQAGDSICTLRPTRIQERFLGHSHMQSIALCPLCQEAYPHEDGPICRACQGEDPSDRLYHPRMTNAEDATHEVIPVEEAVGRRALHDMTRIEAGVSKGALFKAGDVIGAGDLCRLQQMGRFHVAVENTTDTAACHSTVEGATFDAAHLDDFSTDRIHENDVARAFAARMAGTGLNWDSEPHEGKIDLCAAYDGLLCVDSARLTAFNLVEDVMAASRFDASLVNAGTKVAGTRCIPLYLKQDLFAQALSLLDAPLFKVLPLKPFKVGILVTGTEVFQGLIEDRFIPVISAKVQAYQCPVVTSIIAPDEPEAMRVAIRDIRNAGVELLITTGGLSVDPDDITRTCLQQEGLTDTLHGMPLLPGAMSLVGRMGTMQVLGVPACALYFRTTAFDVLLPRVLAGRTITRTELAHLAEGGYCMGCKHCSWPKCGFGK